MAKTIVDIALVEVSYSGGRKLLRTLNTISPNNEDPKTPVKTMNADRRAIGYTRGIPDFAFDMEIKEYRGTPEVDWDALMLSGEEFDLTWEEGSGGKRYTYLDSVVNSVSKTFDSGGEHVRTVSCMALDLKDENA